MKLILTLILVCRGFILIAQECDPAMLAKLPGKWKTARQGSINNVTATDLQKEKTVLNTIYNMVTTDYKLEGVVIDYSFVFSKYGETKWYGDPYSLNMYILAYLCDPNDPEKKKYYVSVSSATNVSVMVNHSSNLDLYAALLEPDDIRGYLRMEKRPEKRNGYWYLGQKVVSDRGTNHETISYEYLITYNDTLPFLYLSRREYLLIQRKRLENSIKSDGSTSYKEYMDRIDKHLQMPEQELAKPAICMVNDEERFNGFVEEGTKGSFIAIKPNPDYFRKNLPLSSPQFFNLVFKVTTNYPVYESSVAGIEKSLDIQKLRAMLGH
ncbi:MAG TPA: hypothetical protein VK166_11930 [Chitinophagaceae bacterium]|nr:hypothetical protein [Chitinophagaceae bacterium]